MAYFAVSYQLNKQKDYQPLWDAFAELNAHKVMRSFYFVDCNTTAIGLRDYLREAGKMDVDDAICVVPMEMKPGCYKCASGTNDWLSSRL